MADAIANFAHCEALVREADPDRYWASLFAPADKRLYALDKKTGKTLWAARAGSNINAVPMTYRTRAGRQFVVLATGRRTDARLVAFALAAPPR